MQSKYMEKDALGMENRQHEEEMKLKLTLSGRDFHNGLMHIPRAASLHKHVGFA